MNQIGTLILTLRETVGFNRPENVNFETLEMLKTRKK